MKKLIFSVILLFTFSVFTTSCRDTKETTEAEELIEEMKEDGAEIKVKEDDGDTKIKMETDDKTVKIKEEDGETKIKIDNN